MKRTIISYAILLTAMLLQALPASAQLKERYTPQRPLVVMCDWEFPPYEFRDNYGRPAGYNVDVLTKIFEQAGIPYKFVMKEWYQVTAAFDNHEADLMVDPTFKSRSKDCYASRTILNYYNISIAYKKDSKPISSLNQLGEDDVVILKNNDYAAQELIKDGFPELRVEYHSPKDALAGVARGEYTYFIWGERPTQWMLKELALEDDINLTTTDITSTEIHFVSYDKELIDEIDDQYARLEQAGEVEELYDKWFHPERIHNDESPIALFTLLAILAVAVFVFLLIRLTKIRLSRASHRLNDLNSMMSQAISIGDYYAIEYDVKADRFRNLFGNFVPENGCTLEELRAHMENEDASNINKQWKQLMESGTGEIHNLVKWYPSLSDKSVYKYFLSSNTVELDKNGQPAYIITMLSNVTHDMEEQKAEEELGNKYRKIFDTSFIAMSFYNKDGRLIGLNREMRELCGLTPESEKFFGETNLLDMPLLAIDFDPKSRQHFHACQRMRYTEIGIDKYIEFRVRPIYNGDELMFYTITARDVTSERNLHLTLRMQDEQLQKTNKAINTYEQQLHYLLEKCDMFVWNSDIQQRVITFSRSLAHSAEFTESYQDYIAGMYPEDRATALKVLGNKAAMRKPINVVHHFHHTPIDKSPKWYAIDGLPVIGADGEVKGQFGVVRDITKLMKAREKLQEETTRAQDSGRQKSVFLANMTHEIRTPLNSIVGFSDLLQSVDDPNDRREFIRIIRNNCDMLLRLINDILEASTIDSNPVAINPTDIDFAQAFDDICQTLAQRVTEPNVRFIKENPYKTFPTHLDTGRIQQVITNFVTNAVKYTHQGHIKVGYRYEDGGLYIYCEDTGTGIPKEKQASVFERFVKLNDFVQGTGLGLAICKSIADRCDGRIGVDSQGEGQGSTFWIWIPCSLNNTPNTSQP